MKHIKQILKKVFLGRIAIDENGNIVVSSKASGNIQEGNNNVIIANSDAEVKDNIQIGDGNEIIIG